MLVASCLGPREAMLLPAPSPPPLALQLAAAEPLPPQAAAAAAAWEAQPELPLLRPSSPAMLGRLTGSTTAKLKAVAPAVAPAGTCRATPLAELAEPPLAPTVMGWKLQA